MYAERQNSVDFTLKLAYQDNSGGGEVDMKEREKEKVVTPCSK